MVEVTYRPNGSGNASDLEIVGGASNYDCVDDVISDGASTYVKNEATGASRDTYVLPDPGVPITNILEPSNPASLEAFNTN